MPMLVQARKEGVRRCGVCLRSHDTCSEGEATFNRETEQTRERGGVVTRGLCVCSFEGSSRSFIVTKLLPERYFS